MNFDQERAQAVSVIGLGNYGMSLCACLASGGHQVIGLDCDENKVNLLRKGLTPVFEPELDKSYQVNRNLITTTVSYQHLISQTQVTFIAIPIYLQSGVFVLNEKIFGVLDQISAEIRAKEDFHIVILARSVLPEVIENRLIPSIEERSGKISGSGFGFCYLPFFAEKGQIIQNLSSPDIVLLGESDIHSGDIVHKIVRNMVNNNAEIIRSNFMNIEISRLAINSFKEIRLAFKNMLNEICEALPGANYKEILKAVSKAVNLEKYSWIYDSRINPLAMSDNLAFQNLGQQLNKNVLLPEAAEKIHNRQVHRIIEMIFSRMKSGANVGILGIAVRPNTASIENSVGIKVADHLIKQDIVVNLHDPMALPTAKERFLDKANYFNSLEECIDKSDILVILTPWREFKKITPVLFETKIEQPIIIDWYNILDDDNIVTNFEYVTPGYAQHVVSDSSHRCEFDYNLIDLMAIQNISTN